jgi:hypothetical protein
MDTPSDPKADERHSPGFIAAGKLGVSGSLTGMDPLRFDRAAI